MPKPIRPFISETRLFQTIDLKLHCITKHERDRYKKYKRTCREKGVGTRRLVLGPLCSACLEQSSLILRYVQDVTSRDLDK